MTDLVSDNPAKKKSARILIVDDEEDIRAILQKGLIQEGFEVDSSGDPHDVAARYREGDYDLILLDIRMPQMSGFELYRRIHKVDTKVKVCFITAFEVYYDEFRKVFPKLRVSCFVRKPVTISQLAKVVRGELGREQEPAEQIEKAPRSPPVYKR